MDTLKRVFKIQDSTWHSLIKGRDSRSLVLSYRDTTENRVSVFLTSHPRVESVQTVFSAEGYVFGGRITDVITAIVTLVPPTPKKLLKPLKTSVNNTNISNNDNNDIDTRHNIASESEQPQAEVSGQWRSVREQPSDSSSSSDSENEISERPVSSGSEVASSSSSGVSPLTPEVQAAIREVLTEYSNQQLLAQFKSRFKVITIKNVLKIPKYYVPCFSQSLRTAYFTLRRKAKIQLRKPNLTFKPIELENSQLTNPSNSISPFAKRMIEKMTSGEVVNKMFSFDYGSHRLLQRMTHDHQSLLYFLKTHRRGAPVRLRSNRSLVVYENEAQFIAYLEGLLKRSYPGEDLARVPVERLDTTPLRYREPFIVQVRKCRSQPTYEFCLQD